MSRHLSRKVSRKTTSTDAAVKKVSRNKTKTQEKKLDRSTSCQEAIRDSGTFSIDPPSCQEAIRDSGTFSIDPPSCQEAIRDSGTFSIDPPSCRGSIEIVI